MAFSTPAIEFDFFADAAPEPAGVAPLYNQQRADRAVAFLKQLRIPEGDRAGDRFPLADWQEEIVRRIYGPTDARGRRLVQTVFILMPRGCGKTTLSGAIGLLHLIGPEAERGGQIIAAAADRGQAEICFKAASRMVAQSQALRSRTSTAESFKRIRCDGNASELRAISHEAYSKHGMSISCLIADEVHAWPTRDLWEVLRTSMGKRAEPLTVVITTAGIGTHGLAWELYDYAKRVEAGTIDDSSFLPILFEAPRDADWRDEAIWLKYHPALRSGFFNIDVMRRDAREAESIPSRREAFKRLYLNIWSDGAADPWLDMDVYDAAPPAAAASELEGEVCYLGVDLAAVEDLTAVVAAFPDDFGGYDIVPHIFIPGSTLRKRQDRDPQTPWLTWAEQGLITVTKGDVVDYDAVESCIRDLCERHRVREIAIDPYGARPMMNKLNEDGLPVVEFRQGFISMGPAVKEMQRAILGRTFRHGGHPVLRWNVQNAVIVQDDAGNSKFTKRGSLEKIDAAVAAAMAIARASTGQSAGSIYFDTDQRPEGLLVF